MPWGRSNYLQEHNTDEIRQVDAIIDTIRAGRDILGKGEHISVHLASLSTNLRKNLDEFNG